MRADVAAAVSSLEILELAQALVRTNSINPPGYEQEVANCIAGWAKQSRLESEIQLVSPGRANVLVRLPGQGVAPTLVYCGHLDTVPLGEAAWDHEPLDAEVSEGRLWGRGSVDMKGGVAAMLGALAALRRAEVQLPGDLLFVGTADEEVDFFGSREFAANAGMDGAGWLIIGEPTNLDLVPAHRGVLWLEVTTYGKSAHGSMPHLGINAVVHMAELIQALSSARLSGPPHPLLPPPTLSVNTVAGGDRINVIPDLCRASIDIRTVPGQDHGEVLATLQQVVAGLADRVPGFRADFRILTDRQPVETPLDEPLLRAGQHVARQVLGRQAGVRGVSYCTDASILQPAGKVPTLIFGPGDERLAHQRDEYVEVEALLAAYRFYAELPFKVFGQSA